MTDGLPVVPVTEALVSRVAVVDRDPMEELGEVPPRMGVATVPRSRLTAVLAGCKPAYFPVVLAATEAVLEEVVQSERRSGHDQSVCAAGRGERAAGRHAGIQIPGYNCFGQGNRANATVGVRSG